MYRCDGPVVRARGDFYGSSGGGASLVKISAHFGGLSHPKPLALA